MLLRVISSLDAVNRRVGHAAAWLALAMVLVQFTLVVLRYEFSIGFVWMQESVLYFYGTLFMAGVGYALLRDGHVRVDVFYRTAAPCTKALIDLAGAVLFVLPVSAMVLWLSWDYVVASWALGERSSETLGLPLTFAYKTVIWLFAVLLGLQGLSMALRCGAYLAGMATAYPPGANDTGEATDQTP